MKKSRASKRKNGETPASDSTTEPAGKRTKSEDGTGKWEFPETMMVANFDSRPSGKIAGFDMDGTLISTKSGAVFPKNKDDWKLWNPCIPQVLKDYTDKGFRIVIFTNQAGIGSGKVKKPDFEHKLANLQAELKVPLLVVAATEDDKFHKPSKGMWEHFDAKLNGGVKVDLAESVYVGDAAGRPARAGKKRDFSDSDLKFALNVGLKFKTPEAFFLGEKEEAPGAKGKSNGKSAAPTLSFDPSALPTSGPVLKGESSGAKIAKDGSQEVVIFVGAPASGKSTFWQNHLASYVRVNRDTLKTIPKCVSALESALKDGKSCVVDNTNPTPEARKVFIDVAKKQGVPVRCFWFNVSKEMAIHMDKQRRENSARTHLSKHVGKIPIYKFLKEFKMPTTTEGFDEVKEVCFVGKFVSEDDKKNFCTFN